MESHGRWYFLGGQTELSKGKKEGFSRDQGGAVMKILTVVLNVLLIANLSLILS